VNRALDHLKDLVGFDTRNPPRAIPAALFDHLQSRLAGKDFAIETKDHGAGCLSLFARRGEPRLIFNFHLDTVPAADGWSGDPFLLRVDSERAIGLGACDVKGAAAAMLAALDGTDAPAALLFTTDEEAGDDRCIREFLHTNRQSWRGAVVAEPTNCKAVIAHRGLATASGLFRGIAGHGSAERALTDSALHEAVRWASRALAAVEEERDRAVGGLTGLRFNLGVLHGGTKSNMIADSAQLRFGVRSRPGEDPRQVVMRLQSLAPDPARVAWEPGFAGPSLPAPGGEAAARAFASELGLPVGDAVDFWSEAALFAEAGFPSLVFGPGSIAQAHAADEWVALAQLRDAEATYRRILDAERAQAK